MKEFFFAFILATMTSATYAQGPRQKHAPIPPQSPQVEILSQPDSPLRIVSVQTKWAVPDRTGIEFYIVVENVNAKTISAYVTRDDGPAEGIGTCWVLSAKSRGKALRPGQSEGRSTWRGYIAPAPLRRLVDFVEFTDGTTWGTDVCQSAESLAGVRAGAREARKLLLEIFASGGADAVVGALKSGLTEVEPPPNHSLKWKQGFGPGFSGYVERIRQEVQAWGYTEIEYALKRPIDALGEKEL